MFAGAFHVKLDRELLAKAAGVVDLDGDANDRLESYASLLAEANEKINLISRSVDLPTEIQNQIALSLAPARLLPQYFSRWIDVGSGGGFPVVPLAVYFPRTEFTAVEQIAKKAYFVERTAQSLGLRNLKVLARPIGDVIVGMAAGSYEVVSVKAVTDLGESFRWSDRILRSGGLLVTYKPGDVESESKSLFGKYEFKHKASLDVKELIDTIDVRVVVYEKS